MLSPERSRSEGNNPEHSVYAERAESPLHAMSIDVEDYFHVAALSDISPLSLPDALPK